MLTALSSHYWRPDFSPAQAASLVVDYCNDLADCRLDEIEVAIREYRRGDQKFFPKIGQLREIITANRKFRREIESVKPVKSQFDPPRSNMWWMRAKEIWPPYWRESEVPAGEKIRDVVGGKLRDPTRA